MLPQKVLTHPSSFHNPFQSQRPRLGICFVKPESHSCILLNISGEKEYLLPSIPEGGDAAVSHQDSIISGSPKQEGSLNAGKKKAKQKSTPMLSCLEENWPEILNPLRKRKKNDCETQNTEVYPCHKYASRKQRRSIGKEKEMRSWPPGRNCQGNKEIQPKRK